jgi:hypothetical protein
MVQIENLDIDIRETRVIELFQKNKFKYRKLTYIHFIISILDVCEPTMV